MAQKNELIAYALDFVSYLISKIKADKLDRIILYGSIARDDFDEDSDIDLFVDAREEINKKVQNITDNYCKTQSFREWNLKGLDNTISCIVGDLNSEEWKDLKRSIMDNGIILYGKFKAKGEKINQYVLFSFENIKPDKKRISVHRKLFGFKIKGRKYPGILDKINAVKVGKGSILVSVEHANKIKKYLQEKKVSVKLYDLWSDSKII